MEAAFLASPAHQRWEKFTQALRNSAAGGSREMKALLSLDRLPRHSSVPLDIDHSSSSLFERQSGDNGEVDKEKQLWRQRKLCQFAERQARAPLEPSYTDLLLEKRLERELKKREDQALGAGAYVNNEYDSPPEDADERIVEAMEKAYLRMLEMNPTQLYERRKRRRELRGAEGVDAAAEYAKKFDLSGDEEEERREIEVSSSISSSSMYNSVYESLGFLPPFKQRSRGHRDLLEFVWAAGEERETAVKRQMEKHARDELKEARVRVVGPMATAEDIEDEATGKVRQEEVELFLKLRRERRQKARRRRAQEVALENVMARKRLENEEERGETSSALPFEVEVEAEERKVLRGWSRARAKEMTRQRLEHRAFSHSLDSTLSFSLQSRKQRNEEGEEEAALQKRIGEKVRSYWSTEVLSEEGRNELYIRAINYGEARVGRLVFTRHIAYECAKKAQQRLLRREEEEEKLAKDAQERGRKMAREAFGVVRGLILQAKAAEVERRRKEAEAQRDEERKEALALLAGKREEERQQLDQTRDYLLSEFQALSDYIQGIRQPVKEDNEEIGKQKDGESVSPTKMEEEVEKQQDESSGAKALGGDPEQGDTATSKEEATGTALEASVKEEKSPKMTSQPSLSPTSPRPLSSSSSSPVKVEHGEADEGAKVPEEDATPLSPNSVSSPFVISASERYERQQKALRRWEQDFKQLQTRALGQDGQKVIIDGEAVDENEVIQLSKKIINPFGPEAVVAPEAWTWLDLVLEESEETTQQKEKEKTEQSPVNDGEGGDEKEGEKETLEARVSPSEVPAFPGAFLTEGTVKQEGEEGPLALMAPSKESLTQSLKGLPDPEKKAERLLSLFKLRDRGANAVLLGGKDVKHMQQEILSYFSHLCTVGSLWGCFLVVTDEETVESWADSVREYAEELRVMPYWGDAKDRAELRTWWSSRGLYTREANFHVLVTTFSLLALDLSYFLPLSWQCVLFDRPFPSLASPATIGMWTKVLGLRSRQRLLYTPSLLFPALHQALSPGKDEVEKEEEEERQSPAEPVDFRLLIHFVAPPLFDTEQRVMAWSFPGFSLSQLSFAGRLLAPFILPAEQEPPSSVLSPLRRGAKMLAEKEGTPLEGEMMLPTELQRCLFTHMERRLAEEREALIDLSSLPSHLTAPVQVDQTPLSPLFSDEEEEERQKETAMSSKEKKRGSHKPVKEKKKIKEKEKKSEKGKGKLKKRVSRCGKCAGCKAKDCRKCRNCKDMKKYGGKGERRKSCKKRKCKKAIVTYYRVTADGREEEVTESGTEKGHSAEIKTESKAEEAREKALPRPKKEKPLFSSATPTLLPSAPFTLSRPIKESRRRVGEDCVSLSAHIPLPSLPQPSLLPTSTAVSSLSLSRRPSLTPSSISASVAPVTTLEDDPLSLLDTLRPEDSSISSPVVPRSASKSKTPSSSSLKKKGKSTPKSGGGGAKGKRKNASEVQTTPSLSRKSSFQEGGGERDGEKVKKRTMRCGKCEGCLAEDCMECLHCKDMKKYGGPGLRKQGCKQRKCITPIVVILGQEGREKGGEKKDGEYPPSPAGPASLSSPPTTALMDIEQEPVEKKRRGKGQSNGLSRSSSFSSHQRSSGKKEKRGKSVNGVKDSSTKSRKRAREVDYEDSLGLGFDPVLGMDDSPPLPEDSSLSFSLSGTKREEERGKKDKGETAEQKRTMRCGKCAGCLSDDCMVCSHCRDMKKYGGPGMRKQSCKNRKCTNPVIVMLNAPKHGKGSPQRGWRERGKAMTPRGGMREKSQVLSALEQEKEALESELAMVEERREGKERGGGRKERSSSSSGSSNDSESTSSEEDEDEDKPLSLSFPFSVKTEKKPERPASAPVGNKLALTQLLSPSSPVKKPSPSPLRQKVKEEEMEILEQGREHVQFFSVPSVPVGLKDQRKEELQSKLREVEKKIEEEKQRHLKDGLIEETGRGRFLSQEEGDDFDFISQRMVDEEKTYTCPQCTLTFTEPSRFGAHVRAHHPPPPSAAAALQRKRRFTLVEVSPWSVAHPLPLLRRHVRALLALQRSDVREIPGAMMPQPAAYAKLEGPGFLHFMLRPRLVLGRLSTSEASVRRKYGISPVPGSRGPDGLCHLGFDLNIDHKHAVIVWNVRRQFYEIKCLSMDADLTVDGTVLTHLSKPQRLDSRALVCIGTQCFFFLLPKVSSGARRGPDSWLNGGKDEKIPRDIVKALQSACKRKKDAQAHYENMERETTSRLLKRRRRFYESDVSYSSLEDDFSDV